MRENPATIKDEPPEGSCGPLRLWASTRDQGELTLGFYSSHGHHFQRMQLQLFRNRAAWNERNSQAGLNPGLECFGGIEIDDVPESFQAKACSGESHLHYLSRARAALAHQERARKKLLVGDLLQSKMRLHDQHQFVVH